jgi:hypothetical protein
MIGVGMLYSSLSSAAHEAGLSQATRERAEKQSKLDL